MLALLHLWTPVSRDTLFGKLCSTLLINLSLSETSTTSIAVKQFCFLKSTQASQICPLLSKSGHKSS